MKYISVLILFANALCVSAQDPNEREVPAVVRQSFTKKFPSAKSVRWSKESTDEFESEFKMNNQEMSANFNKDGNWMVTEVEIKTVQLPDSIQKVLKKDFADYKLKEIEKVETAKNELFYEVTAENRESALEIKFSPQGKIISKENKKDE